MTGFQSLHLMLYYEHLVNKTRTCVHDSLLNLNFAETKYLINVFYSVYRFTSHASAAWHTMITSSPSVCHCVIPSHYQSPFCRSVCPSVCPALYLFLYLFTLSLFLDQSIVCPPICLSHFLRRPSFDQSICSARTLSSVSQSVVRMTLCPSYFYCLGWLLQVTQMEHTGVFCLSVCPPISRLSACLYVLLQLLTLHVTFVLYTVRYSHLAHVGLCV